MHWRIPVIVAPRRCSEGGHGWDRPGPRPQPTEHEWFTRLLGQGLQSSNRGNTCAQSRQRPAAALSAGGQFAQAKDLVPYQSQDKRVRIARPASVSGGAGDRGRAGVAGQYRPGTAQRLAAGRRARSGRTSWSVQLHRPELGGLRRGCPGCCGRPDTARFSGGHDDDASDPPRSSRSTG